ncbi:MAG TPA: hypothetical protein VK474_13755 [Chthoniobacterales bacterium]|nr:hypothetical protein [Chthoniobacterales bacterium]
MMKTLGFVGLLMAGLAISFSAPVPAPARQILGLDLSMTNEAARERLKELGSLVRKEAGWQEVWTVRDPSFSHVIVGFGKDEKLNYITAVARADKEAKRIEYEKIGELKKARQTGDEKIRNFNYQWEIPAGKSNPHLLVIAAGRDPKFLATYSLKNLDNVPAKEEND